MPAEQLEGGPLVGHLDSDALDLACVFGAAIGVVLDGDLGEGGQLVACGGAEIDHRVREWGEPEVVGEVREGKLGELCEDALGSDSGILVSVSLGLLDLGGDLGFS